MCWNVEQYVIRHVWGSVYVQSMREGGREDRNTHGANNNLFVLIPPCHLNCLNIKHTTWKCGYIHNCILVNLSLLLIHEYIASCMLVGRYVCMVVLRHI